MSEKAKETVLTTEESKNENLVTEELEEYADNPADSNVLKLKHPMADGTTELVFDAGRLNGRVLIRCSSLAKKEDPISSVPALSLPYQAHVAAAMTKHRYDEICNLSMEDFTAVTLKAQSFLIGVGK